MVSVPTSCEVDQGFGQVKPKTIQMVFADSPLSRRCKEVRVKGKRHGLNKLA